MKLFSKFSVLAASVLFCIAGFSQTATVTNVSPDGSVTIVYTPAPASVVQPPPPVTNPTPSVTFTASATSVTAGTNVTFSYNVTNATSVSVTDGTTTQGGFPIGAYSVTIPVTSTETVTLTATGAGGTTSKSVTVTVTQPNTGSTGSTGSGSTTGIAITTCGAITKTGNYYLANDVSSSGTCFPIGASNITLNLNGRTITYGTGGGTAPTPAFSACGSFYKTLTASQCVEGSDSNLTVYGGNIVQAMNAAPFSPVFWIGQGGTGGGYIHDLTVTFQSIGSQFFHGEIDGGGYKIQNNVINDNVTNIQQPGQSPLGARAAFQGYVIHTDEENSGNPQPDTISGNTFNGSPQGGVADGVAGSEIDNNTITLTSYYSNDYGVIVTMNNQNVHDNTIIGRGRGLDAESSGFILNNNTINVAEQANNSEYNGCELDGTYGIRIKNYDWPNSTEVGVSASTDFQITNNTVTVPATVCQATAIDLTDMNSLVSGTISNNSFTAVAGSGGLANALGFQSINAADIAFLGNKFNGSTCVLVGGDGDIPYGSYTVASGQTWSCKAGPTVEAEDYTYGQSGATAPVITIQDTLPSPTLSCWAYSTAKINIGGGFSQTCNLKGK